MLSRLTFAAVLFFLLLVSSVTLAQTESTNADAQWWWAWRAGSGDLISYNPDGETHTLATDVRVYNVSRIGPHSALAVIETDEQYALFRLEPMGIVQVDAWTEGTFLTTESDLYAYNVIAMLSDFVIMRGRDSSQVWLFNLNTSAFTPLVDDVSLRLWAWAFSRDGRHLRYLMRPADEAQNWLWSLRERDLQTGVARVVATQTEPEGDFQYTNGGCSAGAFGEYWLCGSYYEAETYVTQSYWTLSLNGSVRYLLSAKYERGVARAASIDDNYIYTWEPLCQKECKVHVYDQSGVTLTTIPISRRALGNLNDIRYLGQSMFLLRPTNEVWVSDKNGNAVFLGETLCCHLSDTTDRILALRSDRDTTVIWDLALRRSVMESTDYMRYGTLLQVDNGYFVVLESASGDIQTQWAYSFSEEQLYKLPLSAEQGDGYYFALLRDNTFLYHHNRPVDEQASSIYAYDATTNTFSLLVEDVTQTWP